MCHTYVHYRYGLAQHGAPRRRLAASRASRGRKGTLHTYISIYLSISLYIYIYTHTYISISLYIYTHTYISISLSLYIYIYTYIHTYIHIYTYIYIYIYTYAFFCIRSRLLTLPIHSILCYFCFLLAVSCFGLTLFCIFKSYGYFLKLIFKCTSFIRRGRLVRRGHLEVQEVRQGPGRQDLVVPSVSFSFSPCHKPHWEAHRRRVWAGL